MIGHVGAITQRKQKKASQGRNDCRAETRKACNSTETIGGRIIVISMLIVILLSIIIIVLDSLNYQYCKEPCPKWSTGENNSSNPEIAESIRKAIEAKSVAPGDIQPSGAAFYFVNAPNRVPSTCRQQDDTFCIYVLVDGLFSFTTVIKIYI